MQANIAIMSRFTEKRVLVVGDLYLDEYIWGDMAEISKEGPIPVIHIKSRTFCPGAAANTAAGLRALGAQVWVVGVVGHDHNGRILLEELQQRGVNTSGIVIDRTVPTNTYTKISAGGGHTPRQEVLRVDTEPPNYIGHAQENKILKFVQTKMPDLDGIVVVDQVCGVVTARILEELPRMARAGGKLLVGDSRERARELRGFDCIVPNDLEAGVAAGIRIGDNATLYQAGTRLVRDAQNRIVMITQGKEGMTVFEENDRVTHLPTFAQEVFDVTGAGDTVTAVVTLALLSGATPVEAAELANYGAGMAVSKPGTHTVSREEIEQAILVRAATESVRKVFPLDQLILVLAALRRNNKKVVWTNGCFDILHEGHISYLRSAKALGDVLVVGLNSDGSVRALKGPGRPVIAEAQRASVLAALACVDYVVIFDALDTVAMLRELKPDVYAKGGDYSIDTINQHERSVVESHGGEIAILPKVEGISTSEIIASIASSR